jgi:hypothetical protein
MEPVVAPIVSLTDSVVPSLIDAGAWSAVQVLPDTVQPPLVSDAVLQEVVPPLAQEAAVRDSVPLLQLYVALPASGDVESVSVADAPLATDEGAVSAEQELLPTTQLREGAAQPLDCETKQLGVPTIDSVPLVHDQVTLPLVGLPVSFSVIVWLFDRAVGAESAVHAFSPLAQLAEGGAQPPAVTVQLGLPTMPSDPLLQR